MSYLVKIAYRNLKRHQLRTLISVLAIALTVMTVIFGRGLTLGSLGSMNRLYIDNYFGHVRVVNDEYRLREILLGLNHTVAGLEGQGLQHMLGQLRSVEGVEHLLPRLRFGAVSSVDGRMVRMVGVGVDPSAEQAYGSLVRDIRQGRHVNAANEILIGSGLLDDLEAELGDRVTIVFSDAFDSLQGRTFEIVGVWETGVDQLDDSYFYLPLATAQKMLDVSDEATEILVFGSNARQANVLEERIGSVIAHHGEGERYSVLAWERANPVVEMMLQTTKLMDIVYGFFIVLGSIVVVTTLIMIIRERTSEIGMMGALGLLGMDIMKVFTLEGAFMGLLGSFLGVIGGGMITLYLSRVGLHVQVFAEMVAGMDLLMEPVLYVTFSAKNLLLSFLLGAAISTVACLYPAFAAAKQEPVDALRTDA